MKITYKRFQEIVWAAEKQPDLSLFLAEFEKAENETLESIAAIHRVTHLKPSDLLKECGLTQTKFAARFMIPLRTVQNWYRDVSPMPIYIKFMTAELLGFFGDLEITV